MINIFKINGCSRNAEKILNAADKEIKYHVPLASYRDSEEAFSKELGMEISAENLEKVKDKCKVLSWNSIEAMRFNPSEDFIKFKLNEYLFYLAAQPEEKGLVALINRSCSDKGAAEYLEKIILADYSSVNGTFSSLFLLLVADSLAGLYSFDIVRNYDRAMELYNQVIERNEDLRVLAEKRMLCCELLSSTPLSLPNEAMIRKITENAKTDNWSKTILAFYFLTTPGIRKEDGNAKIGMRYLTSAVLNNYRPAIYLFGYLGRLRRLKKFNNTQFMSLIEDREPPIIEPFLVPKT